jgi:hypothetical protein
MQIPDTNLDGIAILNPRAIEFAELHSGKTHKEAAQPIQQLVSTAGRNRQDDCPGAIRGRSKQIGEEAHAPRVASKS